MNNRTIKFRVWDKSRNCWSNDWVGINNHGVVYADSTHGFEDLSLHSNAIIQQYTGLKDKEGKEIYEGDILKCKGFDGWFDEVGFYYNREVKYTTTRSGETEISGFLYIPVDREVIGNIFENPELLKDTE